MVRRLRFEQQAVALRIAIWECRRPYSHFDLTRPETRDAGWHSPAPTSQVPHLKIWHGSVSVHFPRVLQCLRRTSPKYCLRLVFANRYRHHPRKPHRRATRARFFNAIVTLADAGRVLVAGVFRMVCLSRQMPSDVKRVTVTVFPFCGNVGLSQFVEAS
jgi:hypothetical protein